MFKYGNCGKDSDFLSIFIYSDYHVYVYNFFIALLWRKLAQEQNFLFGTDFIRRLFNFAWNNAVYGNFLLHHGGKYFLSERITFNLNVAVNFNSGFEFIRCRQTQKNFVEKIFSVIYG